MDKNLKKSSKGLKKEIINLEQSVRTLEEAEYLEENWYPLVFALATEDYLELPIEGSASPSNVLLSDYRKVTFPNIDSSITYVGLDSAKIEEKFFSGACYLDQVKLGTEETKFVQKAYRNIENKGEFGLELVSKRKIILTSIDILSISFSDLLKVSIHNYEKKNQGRHVYSKEEIQKIHERGHVTPFEKVRQWKNLRYCPSSYDLSGKYIRLRGDDIIFDQDKRCKRFESCEECLRDKAYSKEEHEPSRPYEHYFSLKDYYSYHADDMVKKIGKR